ncbi:HD domain-containing protein [Halomonas tibetensis]|uniref:HD domain-containing protein n=1 Tax=Halomonas tibetensis TaxID=2259590 RepID=A0ABV7B3F3_9GAMM
MQNLSLPVAFDEALPPAGASAAEVIAALEQLYVAAGDAFYGEEVTQLEHAIQCAGLARRRGGSDELVVAALLHDIGHLIGSVDWRDANRHDEIGAELASIHFGEGVCAPIRLHAAAKRYLCRVDPNYEASLSAASRHSLAHQGGRMTDDECRAFENHEHFSAAVKLRRWDDAGKQTDLSHLAFRDFLPELLRVLQRLT